MLEDSRNDRGVNVLEWLITWGWAIIIVIIVAAIILGIVFGMI